MASIKIRGQTVDIDIRTEIEQFNWTRPRWSSDKLIAASPMRYDRTPSFFVNLDGEYAGCWGDSGAYDSEWASGGFVKLMSFLLDLDYESAEDYLLETYGRPQQYSELTLDIPKLTMPKKKNYLPSRRFLAQLDQPHLYLKQREISEDVQRQMRTGYCAKSDAIIIPWFDAMGNLANVKYRKTRGKVFWYEKGAVPIRQLVYGLYNVYKDSTKTAYLCEAEIDAMSIMSGLGEAAVAVGGANFTDHQADLIKRSPIERLVIAVDNDKAGEKLAQQVVEKLSGFMRVDRLVISTRYKDVNEAHMGGNLYGCKAEAIPLKLFGGRFG